MGALLAHYGLLLGGGGVVNTYATLNPSDRDAQAALSGGNLTMAPTADTGAWKSARATISKSSGLWYFEFKNNTNGGSGGDMMVGLMVAADSLGSYPGNVAQNVSSIGWQANNPTNSAKFQGGTGSLGAVAGYGTVAPGQYCHFAVNMTTGKVWVRNSSGSGWAGGGDPVAGTTPTFTITAGATVFPTAGGFNTPQSMTANFGATAFNGTVPTGFNAGWYT